MYAWGNWSESGNSQEIFVAVGHGFRASIHTLSGRNSEMYSWRYLVGSPGLWVDCFILWWELNIVLWTSVYFVLLERWGCSLAWDSNNTQKTGIAAGSIHRIILSFLHRMYSCKLYFLYRYLCFQCFQCQRSIYKIYLEIIRYEIWICDLD